MKNFKLNFMILFVWLIIAFIFIFALTMMQYYNVISASNMDMYTFVTLIILALLLGFLSGNIKNRSGLINGILFPTFLFVFFILINIFTHTVSLQFSHIIKYIIVILTSGLGGILGVNFKPIIK